jgi:hypothetical protein
MQLVVEAAKVCARELSKRGYHNTERGKEIKGPFIKMKSLTKALSTTKHLQVYLKSFDLSL